MTMSFQLYVGNYPYTFTEEDIQNVFADFDGITLGKICVKDSKSFCFLHCQKMEQLVSVIRSMNGTLVSGRKLIVRASDDSLQEYVNLLLQEPDCSETHSLVPTQVIRNKRFQYDKNRTEMSQTNFQKDKSNGDFSGNSTLYASSTSCNEYNGKSLNKKFYSFGDFQKRHENNELLETSSDCSLGSSQKSSYQKYGQSAKLPEIKPATQKYQSKYKANANEQFKKNEYSSRFSHHDDHNIVEKHFKNNFDEDSYSPNTSHYDSADVAYSNSSRSCNPINDKSTPCWVSVTNFRYGTTIGTLYDLFSDYEPVNVQILCNEFSKECLTEALVCFENRDIANDVILNFDNTMFQRRLILVNDVEDVTLINELLDVTKLY